MNYQFKIEVFEPGSGTVEPHTEQTVNSAEELLDRTLYWGATGNAVKVGIVNETSQLEAAICSSALDVPDAPRAKRVRIFPSQRASVRAKSAVATPSDVM
jgi:hypothetical protein